MSILRAFIAIKLPTNVCAEIWNQTARLRQALETDSVRWTAAQNLHLTLKFIGEIPAAHLDFLKQALTQTATSAQPFDLHITNLGSFPTSKPARVLWAGFHAPTALYTLIQALEAATLKLGYKAEERAFSPHLTLGRVKQTASPAELAKIRDLLPKFQLGKISPARVDSIHLFQSDLRPTGSVYTKLFSAPLKDLAPVR